MEEDSGSYSSSSDPHKSSAVPAHRTPADTVAGTSESSAGPANMTPADTEAGTADHEAVRPSVQNLLQQQAPPALAGMMASTTPHQGANGVNPYDPTAAALQQIYMNSVNQSMNQSGNRVSMLSPQHPMFHEIQARIAAAQAASGPVLLNRTEGGNPSELEEIGKMAQEGVEETVSDEVFAMYQNKEIVPGCQPHPGDIVEAGSLSALKLPEPVYPIADSLPKEIVTEGKLSSLQLEGVIHACQRHQMLLPNGNRAGFFVGDAAGVGKGRQIAGVVLDNYVRGRTKHIWFSISSDLIVDARRDLTDLGCHLKVIEGCQQLDKETRVLGLPSDFKEGVVFSTYATLVSSVQKGGAFSSSRQSRIHQLVDWCGGEEFNGCLVFDECHKAKNFVPGKEQASTKIALAVTGLQKMLPRARVLYCSATGVSDVKNMAFMERLGLWGDGAAFKSFEQFLETVQRKGLGVAEMLAMEMKTSGMYVARSLSFKQAEFTTSDIKLTKDQVKMFNTGAHIWNELRKSLETAVDRTGSGNTRVWAYYWAAHQRFFKQMCMGIKVPTIVEEAKQALEAGYCVVIGLQTTGEASLESEIAKSGVQLSGFVSLCREIFTRFVEQYFPTMIEGKTSDQGDLEDEWSSTAKQMLLGFVKQVELPPSTLDEIIYLVGGPDKVAEMTGRRGRVVKPSPNDPPHYELRDSDSGNLDSLNVRERNSFMEGRKLVAIISDAASTGISLHASNRAENQRRRVHLTIELPWSADKAVQQLGRSHRSNQSSGPLYKLMTTNLGGERRFAAAVAKRLQSLGALTKGDRRAATGADLAEFNFDTPYGRSALRTMYTAICQRHLAQGVSIQSVTMGKLDFAQFNQEMTDCLTLMGLLEKDSLTSLARVKDSAGGDVGKFLNRILGLSVGRQNLIFNYFSQCLDSQIAMAKREGRYNEGLVDITAASVQTVGEPREVFKDRNNTNNPTKHIVLNIDRGMSWNCALRRFEDHPGENSGFYCSRHDTRHKRFYILATPKDGSTHLFKIARPNTGVSAFDEDKSDLLRKYVPVSQEKAESGWKEQYKSADTQCIHGPNCRAKSTCTVGTRCYKLHLLCGGIVTMMSLLESTIAKYGPKLNLTKTESTLRVVRAKLDSGERVVGIRYPEMLIPLVEKTIKEEDFYKSMVAKQQTQLVMVNGVLTRPQLDTKDESKDGYEQKMAVIEQISAVIPKLVTKAMTPPVTIKSFFKPKICSSDKTTLGSDTLDEPTGSLDNKSESDTESNGRNSTTKIDHSQATKTAVNGSKFPTTTKDASSVNRGTKRTSSQALPSTKGGKRPCVAKQGNIMASFAKQKKQTESGRKCPVCGHEFKPGTSNDEVNKHVDNCLIE